MTDSAEVSADAIFASLVGSAVGDAIGLPYENLSASRAARLLGPPDRFRLVLGHGMVSDDAEHACMTCAAFADSAGDVDRFQRALARRLRWWILTVPPGVGLATLKSTFKLWLGFPPSRSGVRSAGNGPAMRAAVLGRLGLDDDRLFDLVAASTRLTHRDDRAIAGAYAVAIASSMFATDRPRTIDAVMERMVRAEAKGIDVISTLDALRAAAASVATGESTVAFAERTCRRHGQVSGYILETVPIALHAAFSAQDAMVAIREAVRCGGDTDSVASIAGGIVGMNDPAPLERLIEWPCDSNWLRRLALSAASVVNPPRLPFFTRLPRNALLLSIVLAHVGRRCLPPYR